VGGIMTITVYVGDVGEYLADIAKKSDPAATLVDSLNYQNLKAGTYYTSVGDFKKLTDFFNTLNQSDIIKYCPPDEWRQSASLEKYSMQYWTEECLLNILCDPMKKVEGFVPPDTVKHKMLKLRDTRKTQEPQLWIAGCSISDGSGVTEIERYGTLIADELNQPVSFLTAVGSSIKWAADQILRADIQPGDTVFWGITSINRLSYWDDSSENIVFVNVSNFDRYKNVVSLYKSITLNYLVSEHAEYEAITSIYSVCNFCDKNNIKLIMASLLPGVEKYLHDLKNFIAITNITGLDYDNRFLDLGNDNDHPGPITHQYYAKKMLIKYHQMYSTNQIRGT
jgi:hypothetical protein